MVRDGSVDEVQELDELDRPLTTVIVVSTWPDATFNAA